MAKRGWLHRVPPLRYRPRRRRHYELHDAVGVLVCYMLAGVVWLYEVFFWAGVWFYYALFLGVRALVRLAATRMASSTGAIGRCSDAGS